MAVTPQTNTTLSEIAEEFKKLDNFVLCGHVSPDGDCLGSQLGLALALEAMGKQVTCVLVNPNSIEAGLMYLPGADAMVPAEDFKGPVGAFVACDVPIVSRIGAAAAIQERAQVRFTIDHHAVPENMSEFTYVDSDVPACGMLIWELIKEMGVVPTPQIATCLYAALMTDTGRFQYQNTTPEAFACAAEMVRAGANPAHAAREVYQARSEASLNLERCMLEHMQVDQGGQWALSYVSLSDFAQADAVKFDAEPLIDVLRSLAGIKVACILREQNDCVRGSLRAKDDELDVSKLARHIGGGGHKAAAGFTYAGTLSEALEELPAYLDELCSGGAR